MRTPTLALAFIIPAIASGASTAQGSASKHDTFRARVAVAPHNTSRSPWVPEQAFVAAGGGRSASAAVAGVQWPWPIDLPQFAGGELSVHIELAVGRWSTYPNDEGHAVSAQIGVTPILRYAHPRWPRWFVEAGVGVNAVTPVFRRGFEDFSTVFNFGEHVGVGYRAGGGPWEWTLRFQHFSNGDIRKPNPGQDFVQLRLSRWL